MYVCMYDIGKYNTCMCMYDIPIYVDVGVLTVPNSMTVLTDMLPLSIAMSQAKVRKCHTRR